jgi:hypothetical protein
MLIRPLLLMLIFIATIGLIGCGSSRYVVKSPRVDAPPPGKALINFYFDCKIGNRQSIFNGKKELVFLLTPGTIHQLVVDPGVEEYFMACYSGGLVFSIPTLDTMIEIHTEENRIYDVHVTFNLFNVTEAIPAHPGTKGHEKVIALLDKLPTVGPIDRSIPEMKALETKYDACLEKGKKYRKEHPDMKCPVMQTKDSRTVIQK